MELDFNLLTRDSIVNPIYSCDASDLGLPPGKWPMRVLVRNSPYGLQMLEHKSSDSNGTQFYFNTGTGMTVKIYND